MIWILTSILILLVIVLGILLYFLHIRSEKLSKNQALMVEWLDTVRENEETLIKGFAKLTHEFQDLKKEVNIKK